MKKLKDILHGIPVTEVVGNLDCVITKISFDSRSVVEDSMFVAVTGTQTDGNRFIGNAIEAGASAVMCEQLPDQLEDTITYVLVGDTAFALGVVAANFFENPSKQLRLVGVTGTNGKTTVATLLYQLFSELGYACGLLSTVENRVADRVVQATHTTPIPYS